MLKTPLCDLLGIEVPIILAPMGSATSAEFAAAVSNEGGLGGIGSLFRTTDAIKRDIDTVRGRCFLPQRLLVAHAAFVSSPRSGRPPIAGGSR